MLFDELTTEDTLIKSFKELSPEKLVLCANIAHNPLKLRRAALKALWSQDTPRAHDVQHRLLELWMRSPGSWIPDAHTILPQLFTAPSATQFFALYLLLTPEQRTGIRNKYSALITQLLDSDKDKLNAGKAATSGFHAIDLECKHAAISEKLPVWLTRFNPDLDFDEFYLLLPLLFSEQFTFTDSIFSAIVPKLKPEQRDSLIKPVLNELALENNVDDNAVCALRGMRILMTSLTPEQTSLFIKPVLASLVHPSTRIQEQAKSVLPGLVSYFINVDAGDLDNFIPTLFGRLSSPDVKIFCNALDSCIILLPCFNKEQISDFMAVVLASQIPFATSYPRIVLTILTDLGAYLTPDQALRFIEPVMAIIVSENYYTSNQALKAFGLLLSCSNPEQVGAIAKSLYALEHPRGWIPFPGLKALTVLIPYLNSRQLSMFLEPVLVCLADQSRVAAQQVALTVLAKLLGRISPEELLVVVRAVLCIDVRNTSLWHDSAHFLLQTVDQYKKEATLSEKEKLLLKPFIEIVNNPDACTSKRNLALQVLSSWMMRLSIENLYGSNKIDEGYSFLSDMFKQMGEKTEQLSTLEMMMEVFRISVLREEPVVNALGM